LARLAKLPSCTTNPVALELPASAAIVAAGACAAAV
jgi:hypothetical protein